MTVVRKQISKGQVEPTLWSEIQEKPDNFQELGFTGPFPFLNTDEVQTLTPAQKTQAKSNLGLPENLESHSALTLGTENGLSLTEQVLSLELATDTTSGAMSASDKLKLSGGDITQGSGLQITGTKTGRLLSTGDLSFAVDVTVLRTTGEQTIVGQKNTRRAGPNNGSSAAIVKRYEVDNNNLHKLDLLNTQNVQDANGEVQWLYAYTSNAGSNTAKQRDMIGFARGAVTILGGRAVPESYYGSIVSAENSNEATPSWRYPLRQYAYATTQNESLIVGEGLHVPKITGDTKLYVDGGIRTGTPSNGTQATVRLGNIVVDATSTATHHIKCTINGVAGSILFRAD